MQILKNYIKNENDEFYLAYFEKPDANGKYQPDFKKIEELELKEDTINKVREFKEYLCKTDFKFLVGYEADVGEDLELIKQKRKEARDFIRENE